MKLEIEIPDSTVRKIKAWTVLSEDVEDFDEAIVKLIDSAVAENIIDLLEVDDKPKLTSSIMDAIATANFAPAMANMAASMKANRSALSDVEQKPSFNNPLGRPDGLMDYDNNSLELGDEDDHNAGEAAEDEEAFVPTQGGLSEASLERDMYLEDPEHEAVSEGVRDNPGASAEDLFSSSLNLPQIPSGQIDPGVTRREALKRNTQGRRRAKVSGYGGID